MIIASCMPKMDINFRNVLLTKEHGCLKHMKMQLLEKREQWEVVLVNVKHVLRSVLKAIWTIYALTRIST